MISDDKYIELLVSGINQMTMPEAEIECDVKIGNRQFDVVATLLVGMHRVVLAYEVKNKSRRVSVDQIDAFVTKARDANADKTVFVSTAGFQSGCLKVAKRHGMDLFQLTFSDEPSFKMPESYVLMSKQTDGAPIPEPEIIVKDKELITVVDRVVLHYTNKIAAEVPSEASQMRYYMEKTIISPGTTLGEMAGEHLPDEVKEGMRHKSFAKRSLWRTFEVSPPDEYFFKKGRVRKIEIESTAAYATMLSGNTLIETTAFSCPVRYRNVFSGEEITTDISNIPVGSPELEVGTFYFTYFPLRYLYCDEITDGIARMYLVESFQSGELFQAIFTQKVHYGRLYVPVTQADIVSRLKQRLRDMKRHE